MTIKPVALIILDGWGIREMARGNAIAQAHTPNYNRWLREHERSILDASGEAVGLPAGQMGNSEVGHLNLGAGRIVYQDISRIDNAIREGELGTMPALAEALPKLKQSGGKLHLVGLLGSGGVHSHSRHLFALIDLAATHNIDPILHLITDGRDTPPQSAAGFLQEVENRLSAAGIGAIASVSGRYYAMDRDNRWERTKLGYDAIVRHRGIPAATAADAIAASYAEGVADEFIKPRIIDSGRDVTFAPGDSVICFNFRADRMRQMARALTLPAFDGFARDYIPELETLTMTQYEEGLPVGVIFPDQLVDTPLAAVISQHNLRQLHAAETEKYPHVTYFFNGGEETPFPGEERLLVNSPKVATYDLQPEMSALELTDKAVAAVESGKFDFVLLNYANPDMVGHTGSLEAAIKAVETVDACAGKLANAVLAQGGAAIITADHGNCEIMVNELTGEPHTYHTTQPVALFVLKAGYVWLRPRGILADVAPTVLHLLGIEQPPQMSGKSLIP